MNFIEILTISISNNFFIKRLENYQKTLKTQTDVVKKV